MVQHWWEDYDPAVDDEERESDHDEDVFDERGPWLERDLDDVFDLPDDDSALRDRRRASCSR